MKELHRLPNVLYLTIYLFLNVILNLITSEIGYSQSVSVRYIANAGVQISDGTRDVFIDALFDDFYEQFEYPNEQILSLIFNNQGPFTNPRIHLFTHTHRDHFNEELALKEAQNSNSKLIVVPGSFSNPDSLKIISDIFEFESDKRFKIDENLTIHSYKTTHLNEDFKDILNISYLVDIRGKKIFHIGDSEVSSENFRNVPDQEVDLVIIPFFVLNQETIEVLNQKFGNPKIALIHTTLNSKERVIEFINSNQSLVNMNNTMQLIQL
ncbi:MAG: MBL fold metallo-hydrolase [Balneolaceae bacterium]|nr:MBL fold metallo-hydrolase [Balneolaceae bacterium]MBO6547823.1 MBL fold metallo-hydrolase [Balneolaceae bacterium]MBO6648334.1 MBL fold metallo-hydrolase [Balneolaceae bacterium]